MKAFNLLDEPWLPVRMHDGQVRDVGLLEAFARASEISALAETAPPSLIAQYRLLLAITHRALTLAFDTWKDKDRARWYREGLPAEAFRNYLERERERFWLFHPEFPFMQVAALATAAETRDKLKPWTQVSLASANGNAPVIFDHSCDPLPGRVSPAAALRALLGFLQFTPGGLVKVFRDADKAGALANTAAVLPIGSCLSETLCLALHPAANASQEDLPSWERVAPSINDLSASPTLSSGPNDRYTRLTRAVLLRQDDEGAVSWIHFGAGIALEEDQNAPDPMASYRAGVNALVRLTFSEGRAFWRDLPALVPDATGKAAQPAAVLSYAANLHAQMTFDRVYQPVLVAGLASEQAKLLRWRSERISLPAVLLADTEKAACLRELVRDVEESFKRLAQIAAAMVAATLPDPDSKDTRARAREIFNRSPAPTLYFGGAERSLGTVLTLLAEDQAGDAERIWRLAQIDAARAAWQAVVAGMGRSVAALRAQARLWPRFQALLRDISPETPDALTAKEA